MSKSTTNRTIYILSMNQSSSLPLLTGRILQKAGCPILEALFASRVGEHEPVEFPRSSHLPTLAPQGWGTQALWLFLIPVSLQLPPTRRPLRFNLHRSLDASGVVPKAGPRPVLWIRHESPLHRIPVHVPQLLRCLSVNVEVVVPSLPELNLARRFETLRRLLLENLQHRRQRRDLWFADQKMHVLRHQHVSSHHKFIPVAHRFQFALKDLIAACARQQRTPMIATEGDEVKAAGFLDAD